MSRFMLSFARDLDRYPLVNYPGLWVLRYHYVLGFGFAATALGALVAYLVPISTSSVPDVPSCVAFLLCVTVLISLWWLSLQVRDRRSLSFAGRPVDRATPALLLLGLLRVAQIALQKRLVFGRKRGESVKRFT